MAAQQHLHRTFAPQNQTWEIAGPEGRMPLAEAELFGQMGFESTNIGQQAGIRISLQ
jgi:hypothetical protein